MQAPRALVAAALAALPVLGLPAPSHAVVSTGEPAALLVFPLIRVDDGIDSLIELTNSDDAAVAVRCLYTSASGTPAPTTFLIRVAAHQPVAWSVRRGREAVPGSGDPIPPLGAGPVTGTLRCLAAGADGQPSDRNVLVGRATLLFSAPTVDSLQYSATGIDALPGEPNGDATLVLGGPAAEYAPCPAALLLPVFLDGAVLDLGADGAVHRARSTELALVTCAHDPGNGAAAMVDFTLTDEFGQQFSAARPVQEQLVAPLSHIDTDVPSQSIFRVGSQGALSGAIQISARTGSGLLAVALQAEAHPDDATDAHRAALSPQLVGARSDPDVIDLAVRTQPPTPTPTVPACGGDCDGNLTVGINELIIGVGIALGNQPLSACRAFDTNGDDAVGIGELVAAVNHSLSGCS